MVEMMKPGSVIVDLAAEQGGNCELTIAGETVFHNGVQIIGPKIYQQLCQLMQARCTAKIF